MAPGGVGQGGSRGLTMARPRKQPAAAPETERRRWHQGSVREVRPGTWRAWRPRQPDGARPSRTFASEAEAEAWVLGDVLPAVLLLGHWLDRWLALKWPTIGAHSRRNYRTAVAACAPLATLPLSVYHAIRDWRLPRQVHRAAAATDQLAELVHRHAGVDADPLPFTLVAVGLNPRDGAAIDRLH